jgi:hypothetical protein
MSKLARTITIGAVLAAMNLASVTAIAYANGEPPSKQDARRPPTEAQVGESWRHQVAAEEPTLANDSRRPPTEGQVGEPWHHRVNVPVRPAEPNGQPVSLIARLGVLAAILALVLDLPAREARPG